MFKGYSKVIIICSTILILISLFLVVYLVNKTAGERLLNNSQNQEDVTGQVDSNVDKDEENTIQCTQDVMKCPDGSYVGRNPPDCKFSPCTDAKIRKY